MYAAQQHSEREYRFVNLVPSQVHKRAPRSQGSRSDTSKMQLKPPLFSAVALVFEALECSAQADLHNGILDETRLSTLVASVS